MPLLLTYAVTLLTAVLVSAIAHRSLLSTAVLFLAVGFVAGTDILGIVTLTPDASAVSQLLAATLFAVLLTDGMRVGWNELRSAWRLPTRALGWGFPLSLLFMTGLGHVLIGLSWTEALLLGAVLAPTDPVFAAAVVGNTRVPEKLRHMLNVESGVNDGLALPFVVVLLQLAERDDIDAIKIVMELVVGVAIGVGIPWLAVKLERLRFLAAAEQYRAINVVAITLLVFALTKSLHGNLYLAAFTAGVTIATVGEPEREAFHEVGDMAAELLKLGALLAFGALMSPSTFTSLSWTQWLFAVVVIVAVRPAAMFISLIRSGAMGRNEERAAMWFGPKGFASVVYGLLVLNSGIDAAETIFASSRRP